MASNSSDPKTVRFGVFEVDFAAGTIRKSGVRIKLQEQPLQVLALLLERPGEVVTREELIKKLWPDGTFVEFDRSLNIAINKIREALADSANSPRFIETVPRRGYRFIAPVVSKQPETSLAHTPSVARMGRLVRVRVYGVLIAVVASVSLILWWVTKAPADVQDPIREPVFTRLTVDTGLTYQPTLSRDGQFVAYTSDRAGEGNLDIWLQHIGGGDPIRLTREPSDESEPSFSPGGNTVVFRSEQDDGWIYVIPALGGEAKLVAKDGQSPRFSPDGKSIVFSRRSDRQLWMAPASGGEAKHLQLGLDTARFPLWLASDRLLFYSLPGSWDRASSDWWIASIDEGKVVASGAGNKLREAGLTPPQLNEWLAPGTWFEKESVVMFAASQGDSGNIWRIRVNPESGRAQGSPERVTTGPGIHVHPTVSANGRLAFASVAVNSDVWSLPIDANRGRVTGALERLTFSGAEEAVPSVSTDGEILAFRSTRSGEPEIRTKSLPDGKEHVLAPGDYGVISPDGLRVAYSHLDSRGASSLSVMSTNGGIAEKVAEAEGLSWAWGWSHDGRYLLGNLLEGRNRSILLLDLESREQTKLLSRPDGSIFQSRFSPDDNWITFMAGQPEFAIYVARFRGAKGIPPDEWIRVTDGPGFVDKPRWSPDGRLLYFTSNLDGHTCIYAQRLDPETKRPAGKLLDVHHSHDARLSLGNLGFVAREISVARDRLVFNMAEVTGNIWLMEPGKQ